MSAAAGSSTQAAVITGVRFAWRQYLDSTSRSDAVSRLPSGFSSVVMSLSGTWQQKEKGPSPGTGDGPLKGHVKQTVHLRKCLSTYAPTCGRALDIWV